MLDLMSDKINVPPQEAQRYGQDAKTLAILRQGLCLTHDITDDRGGYFGKGLHGVTAKPPNGMSPPTTIGWSETTRTENDTLVTPSNPWMAGPV